MFQVAIPYEEDVDRAIQVLQDAFAAMRESGELPDIIEGPTVLGVQELSERGVELLICARAKTMTQWAMTRGLRKRVKQILEAHHIPIAFPRRLLVLNPQEGRVGYVGPVGPGVPSGSPQPPELPGAAGYQGEPQG